MGQELIANNCGAYCAMFGDWILCLPIWQPLLLLGLCNPNCFPMAGTLCGGFNDGTSRSNLQWDRLHPDDDSLHRFAAALSVEQPERLCLLSN
jgi:hypothetical protein